MTSTRVLDLWPRRAPGLPPGQRRLDSFPRFGDSPGRRPPDPDRAMGVVVSGDGVEQISLGAADLDVVPSVEAVHDFHCVTTWTRCGVRWAGWPMAAVWSELIAPRIAPSTTVRYVVARGGDRYAAVLGVDDLLGPGVLLATELDGAPLDRRHGAPLRLVCPAQYGYKSVKHLVGFELHAHQPTSALGAKEHLRARVAEEERHSRLPGRLLRVPYRLLIAPTAIVAERTLIDPAPSPGRPASYQ
jgi:DMSO/TMAO reductase YedYZ molybdopterin-dependent catalytic subunit